jgi:hypothetical protein
LRRKSTIAGVVIAASRAAAGRTIELLMEHYSKSFINAWHEPAIDVG